MTIEMSSNQQLLEPKQGSDITYQDMVDEREALGESQIQKLFAGTTVLVTGGTGFLGKLLVEKLLRSCPHLTKIYLLGRPKKNKNIATRLEEQFADVLYEKLKKQQPDFVEKVTFIEGDVGHIDLGISKENRKRIQDEVDIIFHIAATVRFDEALKKAVEVNVRGTREMLQLARACTKLRAMVHVSTAYSNCILKGIEEKIYDTAALPGDQLIHLVENEDEQFIEEITPELLGEYPNTYVYSKLAAEDIIRHYCKGLPVAVFRPSIVIATSKEPLPGWIDNVYGSTGVIFGAALGLFHVLKCTPSAISDMVPGDMVVNAMIATVWKMARDFRGEGDVPPAELPPPVFNYVSSAQKPLSWGDFANKIEKNNANVSTIHAVWLYFLILTPSKLFYNLLTCFCHWIPAYIGDAVTTLIGKKPRLIKTYKKIHHFSELIAYFSLGEWKFKNDNVQRLYAEMCYADKREFYFDIGLQLDWDEYLVDYIKGIRVYLVKDPMETVPQGRRHYQRLRILHYTCCTVLCVIIYKFISCVFNF